MSSTDEIIAIKDEIRLLRDINDIKQLPILYCYHVRRFDIDAIFAQFMPDATYELEGMGEPGHYQGDSLRAMMGNGLPDLKPWPLTHNHYVNVIDESHATGFVHAEFRLGKEAYRVKFIGVYEDDYQKLDGVWKFKRRKLTATAL
jgi:hypothetical protein